MSHAAGAKHCGNYKPHIFISLGAGLCVVSAWNFLESGNLATNWQEIQLWEYFYLL